MPKNGAFWRVFENLKLAVKQCYQTGQFQQDKNCWKMPKFKCDILSNPSKSFMFLGNHPENQMVENHQKILCPSINVYLEYFNFTMIYEMIVNQNYDQSVLMCIFRRCSTEPKNHKKSQFFKDYWMQATDFYQRDRKSKLEKNLTTPQGS